MREKIDLMLQSVVSGLGKTKKEVGWDHVTRPGDVGKLASISGAGQALRCPKPA